jgi:hypothetical protein
MFTNKYRLIDKRCLAQAVHLEVKCRRRRVVKLAIGVISHIFSPPTPVQQFRTSALPELKATPPCTFSIRFVRQ